MYAIPHISNRILDFFWELLTDNTKIPKQLSSKDENKQLSRTQRSFLHKNPAKWSTNQKVRDSLNMVPFKGFNKGNDQEFCQGVSEAENYFSIIQIIG